MQAMTSMSINMRVLGKMMKGIQDFDLDIARASIGNIAVLASETPELFKIEAVDETPKPNSKYGQISMTLLRKRWHSKVLLYMLEVH